MRASLVRGTGRNTKYSAGLDWIGWDGMEWIMNVEKSETRNPRGEEMRGRED